ncbi:hypothetical protein, partial [Leisingera sp. MMG026]|uniref:hypothetical protein n=1 Tax=Leisingera sp. MMG026 TaxID=2909982 RepID=UPI001F3D8DE4
EILKGAAADDSHSRIDRRDFLSGSTLEAGRFTVERDEVGERKWQNYISAIELLQSERLVSGIGTKGTSWEVTSRGFEANDLLNA